MECGGHKNGDGDGADDSAVKVVVGVWRWCWWCWLRWWWMEALTAIAGGKAKVMEIEVVVGRLYRGGGRWTM